MAPTTVRSAEALADAYVAGHLPDFGALKQGPARKVDLPTYPFQHRQYATNDARVRAFDAETGRVLWTAALPASGHATPILYRAPRSGRPMLAIAAGGGGRFSETVSDTIVAFTRH